MGRAPKQLIIKNNNQSTNSADNLTAWIHRDPHMWITRLLAVPVLEVSAGARHSAGVALLFGPHCCRGSVGSVVSEAAPAAAAESQSWGCDERRGI